MLPDTQTGVGVDSQRGVTGVATYSSSELNKRLQRTKSSLFGVKYASEVLAKPLLSLGLNMSRVHLHMEKSPGVSVPEYSVILPHDSFPVALLSTHQKLDDEILNTHTPRAILFSGSPLLFQQKVFSRMPFYWLLFVRHSFNVCSVKIPHDL